VGEGKSIDDHSNTQAWYRQSPNKVGGEAKTPNVERAHGERLNLPMKMGDRVWGTASPPTNKSISNRMSNV